MARVRACVLQLLQQRRGLGRVHRPCHQVTLAAVATHVAQLIELRWRFDALGHHILAQRMAQLHDAAHHGSVLGACCKALHKLELRQRDLDAFHQDVFGQFQCRMARPDAGLGHRLRHALYQARLHEVTAGQVDLHAEIGQRAGG
jgi:hypothetical protein